MPIVYCILPIDYAMTNDLLYQLALTQVPQIGCVHAKLLIQQFHTAEAIFKAKATELEKTEGIGSVRARCIKTFNGFAPLEKEIAFIEKYKIKPLFINQPAYPQRLLHCYDSPTMLFYRGNANLNAARMVAVIGTRNNSAYGKHLTQQLVQELAAYDALVVSGLAFGIDAIAHKTALNHNLQTVGVLAHGLDSLYPSEHTSLAKDMIKQGGGLLTEYYSDITAEKHHFPIRNRIISGMSAGLLVVEGAQYSGSAITARLAIDQGREVFAIPGNITSKQSWGPNLLIKQGAKLVQDWNDVIADLPPEVRRKLIDDGKKRLMAQGVTEAGATSETVQASLLTGQSNISRRLLETLKPDASIHLDDLVETLGDFSPSELIAALFELELTGLVKQLPGKNFVKVW